MDDHEAFSATLLNTLRAHESAAGRGPVAGLDVDVLGPQACRAVVAVAAVAQRRDLPTTSLAGKALILNDPSDGSASGVEEVIFNRSAGFRSFSPRCRARFPGCRGRWTGSPPRSPSSGVGDYFRFRLHRGVSHPPDPDHGRVCVIVPATAPQASPRVSGRCRPVFTGVGSVPWVQSVARAAGRSRAISPPRVFTDPRSGPADHSTHGSHGANGLRDRAPCRSLRAIT